VAVDYETMVPIRRDVDAVLGGAELAEFSLGMCGPEEGNDE